MEGLAIFVLDVAHDNLNDAVFISGYYGTNVTLNANPTMFFVAQGAVQNWTDPNGMSAESMASYMRDFVQSY